MIPGIDPKVDIAFKRVFGSPQWRHLTMALIDAVLQPAPWRRLADLELLNPYTEQMTLDDKLSILDIKARDDQGRLFNVEMQMAASASLPQRFLYYWSQLYGSQLARGDDYSQLYPTISICFVNGRMFPDQGNHHRRFRLTDPDGPLVLTDDLDMHVLELVNFQRQLEDLNSPLDFWLYFLKNGATLDADELPAPLDRDELRQAMEVLKMFSQDEMARELYEGRLKAERDAKMRHTEVQQALAQMAAATRQRIDAEQRRSEAEQRQSEAEQRQSEAEQRQSEAEQRQSEAEQQTLHELAKRIQLCERLLARPITDATALLCRDWSALQEMADSLEQELVRSR